MTYTQNGDITMQAGANSYDTPGQSNFIINENGKLESGRDVTLKGRNGDIHISNKTAAKRNVTAAIDEQGSIYFDNELKANGSVSLTTQNGDINVGKDVTSLQVTTRRYTKKCRPWRLSKGGFAWCTLCTWQGQKVSNPRHAVLETAALPAELYP